MHSLIYKRNRKPKQYKIRNESKQTLGSVSPDRVKHL